MTSPSGILLVDKPPGPTSHDVVGRIRRAANTRRVGHAGTLDPFASGLLLLLLESSTRLSEYFLGMDKEYEATVLLGVETTTHDPEGTAVSENPDWGHLLPHHLEAAMEGLRGKISQKPPTYSAKKIKGEPAHRRIRRGEEVELDPVEVKVHELKVLGVDLPQIQLGVRCSSGTYIRALARDMGRALKVGGHLTALRRTSIGPFSVAAGSSLDELTDSEEIRERLLSPAIALAHFPSLEVGGDDAARIRQGQFLPVQPEEFPEETPVRVLRDGELVAVAAREGGFLRPRKVFANG